MLFEARAADNRRMLRATVLVVLSACRFDLPVTTGSLDASVDGIDSLVDGPAAIALCDPDPSLLVCFSFDADPLPGSLANEGSAAIAATLTNVTRIARGSSGAALLDATSQIRVPPNAETMGFATVEAWVRMDADPPVGQRVGIIDGDATSSMVSLFYYHPSPNRQLRFDLGQQLYLDFTLDLGAWHYLAQVCENNTLSAFVDGVKVGERAGCSPGTATTFGLQLGQNNTGTGGDQNMVGAIDGVRMWTAPLSPAAICRTAGRTDC